MILATPLGLLALLAIPVIVAIHLFRRRFPPRPVAGLFLWQTLRKTPEGGGRISRLPVTTSLILECLAALALALILAGLRLSASDVSRHLVVLLDDSASMAAVNARGESSRDRAVTRVLAEIDRLGAGARVTLVQSGERPSVLVGPAALAVEAGPALQAWKPDAAHHSLALGIRLARELAGNTGRLMILSDLSPTDRGETEVEGALWAAVGQPLANVGITSAQRTLAPDEGRGIISLTFANYSDSSTRRSLSATSADKSIVSRELDIPPGISSIAIPIPPGLPSVQVRLSDDALAHDNDVVLVEPRPQIVGVANDLPEGRGRLALAKALGVLAGASHVDSGHLAFSDASALSRPESPGVWRVGFGRAPATWVAPGEAKDFIGPFVLEKRHPLLLGVTLGGVAWAGAAPLVRGQVRPLISAGDQVLAGIVSGPGKSGEADILFNLDLDRTNLIRSPDWPILISNLVEMRRQHLPGPERWNYRAGEWVRVRLPRDPTGPLRFRCGAVERALPAARQLEFLAPSPGGLLHLLEGDRVLFELGVNLLDEVEGDLRRQKPVDVGELREGSGLRAESGPASDPFYWVLLVIGGISIVANWCLGGRVGRRPARGPEPLAPSHH